MPQIAQQDYLRVNVPDENISPSGIQHPDVVRQLAKFIRSGLIYDVILVSNTGETAKIISATSVDADGYFAVVFYSLGEGQIEERELQDPDA